jgi:hypothetical protein
MSICAIKRYMTTNHPALNHIKLATLENTKSILGIRNRTLPDPTTLNNNGIQTHGGPIS